MILRIASLVIGATLLLFCATPFASAEWIAQGVYDPAGGNGVDVSATTTGVGQQIGLADFQTAVAAAYLTGNGGVIDFDTYTGTMANTIDADNIYLSFDGGNKSLTAGDTPNDFVTSLFSGGGRTAISGAYMLGNNAYRGGGSFEFASIGGGQFNEYVTAVGLTLLSRGSGVAGAVPSDYTVTAYFSDNTTASQSSLLEVANGTDDTFFGFVAPADAYIERVVVNLTSGTYHTAIDDFGFITSVVPEPTTFAGLLLLALCLLPRRRR